jgi:hypothetical protein
MGLLEKIFGKPKAVAKKPTTLAEKPKAAMTDQWVDRFLALSLTVSELVQKFAKTHPGGDALLQALSGLGGAVQRVGTTQTDRTPVRVDVNQAARFINSMQEIVANLRKQNLTPDDSKAVEIIDRHLEELREVMARMMMAGMGL